MTGASLFCEHLFCYLPGPTRTILHLIVQKGQLDFGGKRTRKASGSI